MTEEVAKISAWFLMAEGSISLHRALHVYFAPHVWIKNVNYLLLQEYMKLVQLGYISRAEPEKANWKPIYSWQLRGLHECYCYLKHVTPYLVIKGQQNTVKCGWMTAFILRDDRDQKKSIKKFVG
jgi:hypothetical protein